MVTSGTEEPTGDEVAEWVQPTGAHDAYQVGDRVTYNGVVWEPAAELSAAQAQALYEQGVLADARESRIGRVYFCDEPDARITSNLIISIELREENLKGELCQTLSEESF